MSETLKDLFLTYIYEKDTSLFDEELLQYIGDRSYPKDVDLRLASLSEKELFYIWFCEFRVDVNKKPILAKKIGIILGDNEQDVVQFLNNAKLKLNLKN